MTEQSDPEAGVLPLPHVGECWFGHWSVLVLAPDNRRFWNECCKQVGSRIENRCCQQVWSRSQYSYAKNLKWMLPNGWTTGYGQSSDDLISRDATRFPLPATRVCFCGQREAGSGMRLFYITCPGIHIRTGTCCPQAYLPEVPGKCRPLHQRGGCLC